MLDAVLRPPAPKERSVQRFFALFGVTGVALFLWLGAATSQGKVPYIAPAFAGAALLAFGLATADYGVRRWRLLRLIEATPTSTAATVESGVCELEGTVELAPGAEPLRGPRSGKPCAYYALKVEKRGRTSKGKETWTTVKEEQKAIPFLCRDATGVVLVDVASIPPQAVSHDDTIQDGDLRHKESRLDPGDKVYVLGVAHERPAGSEPRHVVTVCEQNVFYLWNLNQHDTAVALLKGAAFSVCLGLHLVAAGALGLCAGLAS
jgi:hypothetical protein